MNKTGLIAGGILGLLTVVIGAFGAHALKNILIENGTLSTFETGVKYQFYHAIALLIAGILAEKISKSWMKRAVYSFIYGIILFSGSLYVLSLSRLSFLGAITPVGGVLLIGGWVCMLWGIWQHSSE